MEEGPDRVCMLRMGQALLEKVLIDMHVGRGTYDLSSILISLTSRKTRSVFPSVYIPMMTWFLRFAAHVESIQCARNGSGRMELVMGAR
jgi:hypothetical protein